MLVDLCLVLDPFNPGLYELRLRRDLGPVKYTALWVGLVACGLAATAFRGAIPRTISSAMLTGWPLTLLATYMLVGSFYARFVLHIKETFLPEAMGMLGFPIAVILLSATRRPSRFIASFFWALLAASPYAMAWIIRKRVEGGQAFHEEIFLILLTILCLLAPVVTKALRRSRLGERVVVLYTLFTALLLLAGGGVFLYLNREQYLPSGSPDVRLRTYSAALQTFLSSPVYGDAFAGPTTQWLVGLHVLGEPHVVTHSDLLDILSHGGAIGFLLLLVGLYRVLSPALRGGATASSIRSAQEHGLVAVVVCGTFVAIFNPPFLDPQIGILFWFAAGALAALHASDEARCATQRVRPRLVGPRSALRSTRNW